MNFSKATTYALHTMLILARIDREQKNHKIGVADLAKQQNISPTYLSKILTKLTKAGLIDSSPGAQGGYSLRKVSTTITFLDIIQAIEGRIPLFSGCEDNCEIEKIMKDYESHMYNYLKDKTLADALE